MTGSPPRGERPRARSASRRHRAAAALLCLAVLVGCQSSSPYVFTEGEFNRSSPEFNKPPRERTSVMVCMSPFADPAGNITALADQECQKYGKEARFSERQFGKCPLLISSGAIFQCVASSQSVP